MSRIAMNSTSPVRVPATRPDSTILTGLFSNMEQTLASLANTRDEVFALCVADALASASASQLEASFDATVRLLDALGTTAALVLGGATPEGVTFDPSAFAVLVRADRVRREQSREALLAK